MDQSKLKITIASDIDYDQLIAEVYYDGEYIFLIQQENGVDDLKVEFSPNAKKEIDYNLLQAALITAKKCLLNKQ